MKTLINNELYKIFHSRRMAIFLGVISIFVIVFGIYLKQLSPADAETIEYLKTTSGAFFPRMTLDGLADSFIPIFITLIIGFFAVEELESGTLKLLLLNGASRKKVMLVKVITEIIVSFSMLLYLFVVSYLFGLVLWQGQMFSIETIKDVLVPYVLTCLTIIPFVLLINFFGYLVKNSGILICVMFLILGLSKVGSVFFPICSEFLIMNYFKMVIFDWQSLNYFAIGTSVIAHIILFWIMTSMYFKKLQIHK